MTGYNKKINFFSHIIFVYKKNKIISKKNFLKNKKTISFENIVNPIEKKSLYNKFSSRHNINLHFKDKNYFIETIGYKNVTFRKKNSLDYSENGNLISIKSCSLNFKQDIEYLSKIIKIKKKNNYFFFKNKAGKFIKFSESKYKLKQKIYLDSTGSNIMSFFVDNISLARKKLNSDKIKLTKIFKVKLLKQNKIFFARFPSGMIFEFLNY